MKKGNKRRFLGKIGTFCLSFLMIMNVNAESKGTMEIVGENDFSKNSSFYQDILITSVDGNINAISGKINIEDSNCVEFDYIEVLKDDVNYYLNKFIYASYENEINSSTKLLRVHFKSLNNTCSTKLYIERPTISFVDNSSILPTNVYKTVNILEENANEKVMENSDEVIEVSNLKEETLPEPSKDYSKSVIKLNNASDKINKKKVQNNNMRNISDSIKLLMNLLRKFIN